MPFNDCSGVQPRFANAPQESVKKEISLYPNPAQDRLFLQNIETDEPITYRIFSSSGRLIQEGKSNSGNSEILLNHRFPSGVFMIQLEQKGERSTHKFYKQ